MLTRSEIAPSPEQVSFFRESGYLVLKGVLAPWELRSLDEGTRRIIDGCRESERGELTDARERHQPPAGI